VTIPKGLFERGYYQSFNFTVERRLPWDFSGQVGYVATRGVRPPLMKSRLRVSRESGTGPALRRGRVAPAIDAGRGSSSNGYKIVA
jgi:hypothetical protein